jgi:hypothetical protein
VNPATHGREPAHFEAEVSTMSLVYDVGMFNGDDTAYYLKKGFRVVGIEANQRARLNFRTAASTQLRVETD